MRVIFIVGLPCSGKTHLGIEITKNGGHFIDDISKQGIDSLNEVSSNLLVISDPYLCRKKDRTQAEDVIKKKFPSCEIRWIFFENSPEKCLINMERRMSAGDNRTVRGLILNLTQEYEIPKDCTIRQVYEIDSVLNRESVRLENVAKRLRKPDADVGALLKIAKDSIKRLERK